MIVPNGVDVSASGKWAEAGIRMRERV
jgi:hypothetical protein